VGLTGVLWYGRDAWARPWFLVWSYFVVALLPVVGLAQMVYFQFSFVADHFQYLAAMGPLALAGAGVARVAAVAGRPWGAGLATVLLLLLGGLSCQRAAIYQNKSVFWNDLLGRPHDAEAEFRQKVALDPRDDTAHIDLGNVLLGEQQTAAALEEFRTAVRLKPGSVIDHYDLANGLMAARDLAAAEAEFRTAINLNPSFGDAHANLGTVLAQRGDLDGAIREYRIAAVLQPTAGDDFYNLGVLLERKGDLDGAIAALQTAVRLTPGNAAFADTLTQALNARPTPAR
jgi:tetratricopeptide (TPR) repeat protein